MAAIDNEELEKCKKTLEECSRSDSGEPVTLKKNKVYKFDDISQLEANKYRCKKKMCSADALYIKNDGSVFLFEFKNTRKGHVPWNSVRMKAHDSLITMQVVFDTEISLAEWASKTTYFLIYNNEKVKQKENDSPHFEKFKQTLRKMADEKSEFPVLGKLEIYENVFYKKVYTIDVKDFENIFFSQIF